MGICDPAVVIVRDGGSKKTLQNRFVCKAVISSAIPNCSNITLSGSSIDLTEPFTMASNLEHTKKTFTLNTGDKIPAIGLGTWQSSRGQVRDAVKVALQKGYRHIDTALAYGNEEEVGQGIKDSGVPREEIWVTTKLDNTWHHRVEEGISTSLKSLGMDYVDLYLVVRQSV